MAAVAVEPVLLRGLYHNSLKDDELRVTQAGMACVMDRQAQPGETQRKQRSNDGRRVPWRVLRHTCCVFELYVVRFSPVFVFLFFFPYANKNKAKRGRPAFFGIRKSGSWKLAMELAITTGRLLPLPAR